MNWNNLTKFEFSIFAFRIPRSPIPFAPRRIRWIFVVKNKLLVDQKINRRVHLPKKKSTFLKKYINVFQFFKFLIIFWVHVLLYSFSDRLQEWKFHDFLNAIKKANKFLKNLKNIYRIFLKELWIIWIDSFFEYFHFQNHVIFICY